MGVTSVAALACWARTLRPHATDRLVWALFATGLSAYAAGYLVLFTLTAGEGAGPGGLNISDCVSLCFYPACAAGVVVMTRRRVAAVDPRALLDGGRHRVRPGRRALPDRPGVGAAPVKIDRTLVAGMLLDHTNGLIVRSTVELAHGLGLRVVAEGVEDEATLQALAAVGCDLAQGFLLGRPGGLTELLPTLPIASRTAQV